MPYEIHTNKEFESIINLKNTAIIHFWAEWNGTDYVMKRILGELENTFDGQAIFGSIDVDNENLFSLCRKMPILNVPTLVYFKNRRQDSIDVGFNPKESDKVKEMIKIKISNLIKL